MLDLPVAGASNWPGQTTIALVQKKIKESVRMDVHTRSAELLTMSLAELLRHLKERILAEKQSFKKKKEKMIMSRNPRSVAASGEPERKRQKKKREEEEKRIKAEKEKRKRKLRKIT